MKDFFSIGNDELEALPELTVKEKKCRECDEMLKIEESGEKTRLHFIKCGPCGHTWLVGIDGKDLDG